MNETLERVRGDSMTLRAKMDVLLVECGKPTFTGTLTLRFCAGELVGVEQSNSVAVNYDGPPGRETRQQA